MPAGNWRNLAVIFDLDLEEETVVMEKDSVYDGVDMKDLFEAIFETRFQLQEIEYHCWKANCQIFAAKVFNLIAANKKHESAVSKGFVHMSLVIWEELGIDGCPLGVSSRSLRFFPINLLRFKKWFSEELCSFTVNATLSQTLKFKSFIFSMKEIFNK